MKKKKEPTFMIPTGHGQGIILKPNHKPQHRNTKLLTISMSEEVRKEFDEFCNEHMTNKSKLISWLIQQHLNEVKGGDK